jgi:ABC-2 type transport system permease protein
MMLVQAAVLYTAVFVPFSAGWHLMAAPLIGIVFSYMYSFRMLRGKLMEK